MSPFKFVSFSVLLCSLSLACGQSTPSAESPNGTPTGSFDAGDEATELHSMLQELSTPYIDTSGGAGKAIGLVVGVATPEGRYIAGFGATELGGDTPPNEHSIFDLASVTKVYTGYLLAKALDDGRVSLEDTLEQTFSVAPSFEGQSISLLDLATHTSGLPNYPDNLSNPGPVNPAAGYSLERLEAFLASHTLARAPGQAYEYSNLASGILGHVLVENAGESDFAALVGRDINAVYGLEDTIVTLNAEQESRRIQGYAEGSPAPSLDIGAPLAGGGLLRSTGTEVLAFFEGAMGSDPIWSRVLQSRRPSPNGTNASTGLMVNMETPNGTTLYSKNGGAPGFSTQVVITLDPPAVVVLLSNNRGTQGLYQLGQDILTELSTSGF